MYGMYPQGEGTLASIPIGISQLNKSRDGHKIGLPTNFQRTFFTAYIPPTLGYQVSELDVIKSVHADNYQINQIYSTNIGLQGVIAIIEKINT
jgi:hypothetical protein